MRRIPEEEAATPTQVQEAINSLSDGEWMTLRKYAWWRIWGVPEPQREGRGYEDLLVEATKQALDGSRRWNKSASLVQYLTSSMGSIASHWKTKKRHDEAITAASLRKDGEDGSTSDPIEGAPGEGPSPERAAIIRDMFSEVERLFKGDASLSLILQAMRDGWTTAEIAAYLEVEEKQVEAKKKLIGRHIRAAFPKGMNL